MSHPLIVSVETFQRFVRSIDHSPKFVCLSTSPRLHCTTREFDPEVQDTKTEVKILLDRYRTRISKTVVSKQKQIGRFSKPAFCECGVLAYMNSDMGAKTHLGRVKRICVFEHSVMTNFNCACPAIQRGQGPGFLSEDSSWFTACMSEQRRFWRDCADAQARLNLRCSHRR